MFVQYGMRSWWWWWVCVNDEHCSRRGLCQVMTQRKPGTMEERQMRKCMLLPCQTISKQGLMMSRDRSHLPPQKIIKAISFFVCGKPFEVLQTIFILISCVNFLRLNEQLQIKLSPPPTLVLQEIWIRKATFFVSSFVGVSQRGAHVWNMGNVDLWATSWAGEEHEQGVDPKSWHFPQKLV